MIKKLLLTLALTLSVNATLLKHLKCDQMLYNEVYQICYSYKTKTPLYTKYTLYSDDINERYPRTKFHEDTRIPYKYRQHIHDYAYTNYDRGHLAPRFLLDFSYDIEESLNLMSNTYPQVNWLNRGLWRRIEGRQSKLTFKYGRTFIKSGIGSFRVRLDGTRIYIPDFTWIDIRYKTKSGYKHECYSVSRKTTSYRSIRQFKVSCSRIYRRLNYKVK